METTNNHAGGETGTNKTAVLSLNPVTLEMVLLILNGNKIESKIIATDQEEKSFLQVYYKEDQQEIIDDTVRVMDFFNEAATLFIPMLKTALTTLQDKSEEMLKDLSEKYAFKKHLNLGNLSTKSTKEKNHGNV